VRVEVSDPTLLEDLRSYLLKNGCPSEPLGAEICEVRVLWSEGDRSDSADRLKIFGHLREWCAEHPGVKANILTA
jgi:hypothetical protein